MMMHIKAIGVGLLLAVVLAGVTAFLNGSLDALERFHSGLGLVVCLVFLSVMLYGIGLAIVCAIGGG